MLRACHIHCWMTTENSNRARQHTNTRTYLKRRLHHHHHHHHQFAASLLWFRFVFSPSLSLPRLLFHSFCHRLDFIRFYCYRIDRVYWTKSPPYAQILFQLYVLSLLFWMFVWVKERVFTVAPSYFFLSLTLSQSLALGAIHWNHQLFEMISYYVPISMWIRKMSAK